MLNDEYKAARRKHRDYLIFQCENSANFTVEELKDIHPDGEEFWYPSSLDKLKEAALHQTFRVIQEDLE